MARASGTLTAREITILIDFGKEASIRHLRVSRKIKKIDAARLISDYYDSISMEATVSPPVSWRPVDEGQDHGGPDHHDQP